MSFDSSGNEAGLVWCEEQLKGWKALAEGRDLLLVAYRTGRQPSEKAFKLIDKARKILGEDIVK